MILQVVSEWWAIICISILMAISPGPDFFMITRNSILYGKRAGGYSVLGVGLALWLHVAYCIAGLAIIISKSILLFSILKYIGAAYLIVIGFKTLFVRQKIENKAAQEGGKRAISSWAAFKMGFVTNALNPKATIFFMSIFTQIVDVNTSLYAQVCYGGIICVAHLIWFYVVVIFFSHPVFLDKTRHIQKYLERVMGAALIAFGLKVAVSSNE